jgi:ribosomal protein L16/L10AE
VSTGQIPFEMDGVSLSNARQAATLAAHKLCSSTKELGEVFVPERRKWKDTKGEGYTPLFL